MELVETAATGNVLEAARQLVHELRRCAIG